MSVITLKPTKLTKKDLDQPTFYTIGQIRAIAQNTNNPRLLALIDKVAEEVKKELYL